MAKGQTRVARQLEQLRAEVGLTRKQVAGRLGKTRQAVDAALSGRSRMPLEDAEKVAEMLGASLQVVARGNPANALRRALDADDLTDEWREAIWAVYERAKTRSLTRRSRAPAREQRRAASSSR